MANPPFDLFVPQTGSGTFLAATVATLSIGVPANTVIAVAYVHNASVKDTVTVALARGGTALGETWTVLPDAYLPSNSQTFIALSAPPVNLLAGDTVTVTSSVSRSRRELHGRAFPGQLLAGNISGLFTTNSGPLAVPLAAVPAGAAIFAVVGCNGGGGAVTFGPPNVYTDPRTITSTAGSAEKTLADAYRIAAGAGSTSADATLAVAGPAGLVAVALPSAPVPVTSSGGTYQRVNGVWT